MFIIFGTRRMRSPLATVMLLCQRCQRPSAHAVFKLRTWFTLFFIPLVPFSVKYATACPMCGAGTQISKEQAEHMESAAAQQAAAPVEMTADGPITPYSSTGATMPRQSALEDDGGRNPGVPASSSTSSTFGGPPAPGWWLASDENWYPPELHPDVS